MIEIPHTLQKEELRFVKLIDGKRPFEQDWQNTRNYKYNDPRLVEWISNGNNYGVLCGVGGLIVIDADTIELKEKVEKSMPKTFTVKTGRGGSHFYYLCPEMTKKVVLTRNNIHYGEVQSTGTQVVAPTCIHPNGNKYEIVCNGGITSISKEQLLAAIFDFEENKKKEIGEIKRENKEYDNISITDVINTCGMERRGNECYGSHPVHGSDTGMNFYVNDSDNVWHCFRCNSGGGALQWIAVNEGLIQCHEAQRGVLKGELFKKVLKIANEKYKLNIGIKNKNNFQYSMEEAMTSFNDFINLSKDFIAKQPLYFDNSRIWWYWDFDEYRWKIVDETDIMIMIDKNLKTKERTTASNIKNEILEALKRVSRENKPLNIKDTWIQFKNKIIDIDTGEEMEANSSFFATNPIPVNVGNSTETPILDKLFEEWVGKEYVNTLYEVIAFSISPTYFLHRVFCFMGAGNNGKSTFFNIIKQFVGNENVTSTELDDLLTCRFEKAKLYKKLICFMGETNFGVMKKTSLIKRLTGQDLIGFEFKNKDPFDDINYAKIFIATNALPICYDKTNGWYRRWIIIDFPNDFEGKERDILEEIPEEEYMNLARKCIGILTNLRKVKKFTNEGSIADRKARFEEKSNPLLTFIRERCITVSWEETPFWEFFDIFKAYLKENNHREWSKTEVSRGLREEGFDIRHKNSIKEDGGKTTVNYVFGLTLKNMRDEPLTNPSNINNTGNTLLSTNYIRVENSIKQDISDTIDIIPSEKEGY